MDKAIYNIKLIKWLISYDENYNVNVIPYIINNDYSKFKVLTTGQIFNYSHNEHFVPDVLKINIIKKNFIQLIDKKLYVLDGNVGLIESLHRKFVCRFKSDNQLLTLNQVKILTKKIETVAKEFTKKDIEKIKAENLKKEEIAKIEEETFNF